MSHVGDMNSKHNESIVKLFSMAKVSSLMTFIWFWFLEKFT